MSGLLATQGVTPTADEVAVSLNGASARAGAEHVLVPLCLELIADLETPVSAFLKLRAHMYAPGAGAPSPPLPPPLPLKPPGAAGTRAFLLESVEGGERLARYSIVGFDPRDAIVSGTDGGSGDDGDPLAAVEAWLAKQQVVVPPVLRGQLPAGFTGGAVGYVGYDAVRHWEPRTARALGAQVDALGIPEAAFLLCDDLLVFDHVRHTIKIVAHMRMEAGAGGAPHLSRTIIDAAHAAACSRIAAICERLAGPLPARDGGAPTSPVPLRRTGGPSAATVAAGTGEGLASVAAVATGAEAAAPPPAVDCDAASNMGRTGYEGAVRSLKEHIVAGNIIQAVPSHRVECALPPRVSAFDVYRHLRIINPSPYMFYLDLGPDFQIVGASPEMLVKVTADGSVQTHPIAGTRPRGATPEEDDKLAEELLADAKERAEHVMLVDLGRNDIGRVAAPGSVRVEGFMHIEKYSHVQHIVSVVVGRLAAGRTAFDAFRAVFPAGTVSGAPKVMAVELVAALERERRGVYAGAVGYFSYSGVVDTAIAIRTLVVREGSRAFLQAGAGIVYDSVPASEYDETVAKMRGAARSIEAAIATAARSRAVVRKD